MNNIFAVYPAISCFVGVLYTLFIAFLFSSNKKLILCKNILLTILLEIVLACGLLKTYYGNYILILFIRLTQAISNTAQVGIDFVFGNLGTATEPWGFVFALHVLPVIIFFSALISVFSYLGIIDFFIKILSYIVRPLLGTTSPETTCAIAKSFLGPVEAQLFIRDYLFTMSNSEMFAVMVSCLSMISASLFSIYIGMGIPGHHLIAANFMGILSALLFSKIIMPYDPTDSEKYKKEKGDETGSPANVIEALIQGTSQGLQLVLIIAALLISFMSFIHLLDKICIFIGGFFSLPYLTFQNIVSYIFAPFGFLMGLPSTEAFEVSKLVGIKLIANEMVAFAEVGSKHLSDRGLALATYALCGFANIATVGIVVGSISTIVKSRRSELSALGPRALLAATLANLFSAYLVGIIL